jgi:hypothetical protein
MSGPIRHPRCWLCRVELHSALNVASTALGYECGECTANLNRPLTASERSGYQAFKVRADACRAAKAPVVSPPEPNQP